MNVVARLAAARHVASSAAGKRAIHAMVSPPPGEAANTIAAFYGDRRRANEIAKEHGIRGGVVVAHGYRATEEAWNTYKASNPDRSLWWWIRDQNDWRELVEWSPHYHVIGIADPESIDPETGRGGHIEPGEDRRDGWVFKNIRSLDRYEGPRDYPGTEDMVGVVRYLLSHATFPHDESRQAVTWFGGLHGTNFNPEEEVSAGSWSVIQRVTEELVGAEGELEDDDGPAAEEKCEVEGCEGQLIEIFHWHQFEETNGQVLTAEQRHRVETAYRWASGKDRPPPGMMNPDTIERAEEALAAML